MRQRSVENPSSFNESGTTEVYHFVVKSFLQTLVVVVIVLAIAYWLSPDPEKVPPPNEVMWKEVGYQPDIDIHAPRPNDR